MNSMKSFVYEILLHRTFILMNLIVCMIERIFSFSFSLNENINYALVFMLQSTSLIGIVSNKLSSDVIVQHSFDLLTMNRNSFLRKPTQSILIFSRLSKSRNVITYLQYEIPLIVDSKENSMERNDSYYEESILRISHMTNLYWKTRINYLEEKYYI